MRINDSGRRNNGRGDFPAATHAAPEQRALPLSAPDDPGGRGYDYDASMTDLAVHAGLVLSYNGATFADVFLASGTLVPPCLIYLADQNDETTHIRLRALLAAEHVRAGGLAGLLGNELAFQAAVVDALGSETLIVLADALHEIIGCAMSRLVPRSASVRHLPLVRPHHEIIHLVAAGRGRAAAALAWVRTKEIERILRDCDTSGGRLSRLILS